MQKDRFDLARNFITTDIEREIRLARMEASFWRRLLSRTLGFPLGGGNFLAALGLLCCTEFAGRLKRNDFSDGNARVCFDDFFRDLGAAYATLLQTQNIYKDLRCGLTHEYFVKRSCAIAMLSFRPQCGVQWDGKRYLFVVEAYWKDFRVALEVLEQQLYNSP
jgi:hypothetical protein